jgi:hypothetical protein
MPNSEKTNTKLFVCSHPSGWKAGRKENNSLLIKIIKDIYVKWGFIGAEGKWRASKDIK